jgi:hypothetical protein
MLAVALIPARLAAYIAQACRLAEARARMIHRDIKPANLSCRAIRTASRSSGRRFRDRDGVHRRRRRSAVHTVLGSVGYMSPSAALVERHRSTQ